MLGDAGLERHRRGRRRIRPPPGHLGPLVVAVLAVVALANVASELVSFSRVIDAVPPLRWFDRLGRRRTAEA